MAEHIEHQQLVKRRHRIVFPSLSLFLRLFSLKRISRSSSKVNGYANESVSSQNKIYFVKSRKKKNSFFNGNTRITSYETRQLLWYEQSREEKIKGR